MSIKKGGYEYKKRGLYVSAPLKKPPLFNLKKKRRKKLDPRVFEKFYIRNRTLLDPTLGYPTRRGQPILSAEVLPHRKRASANRPQKGCAVVAGVLMLPTSYQNSTPPSHSALLSCRRLTRRGLAVLASGTEASARLSTPY